MFSESVRSGSKLFFVFVLLLSFLGHGSLYAKPAWKDGSGSDDQSTNDKPGGQKGKNKTSTPTSEITITDYPESQTVLEGQSITFSVVASSSDGQEITYQWYFNDQVISGANNSNFVINLAKDSDQGEYSVLLSTADTSMSAQANLIVESDTILDIEISFHPMSQEGYVKDNLTLNVSAQGTESLNYQWRKNGINIPGAVYEHLYFESLTMDDEASYDVVVSNQSGSVVSKTAQVSVKEYGVISLVWDTPFLREDGSTLSLEEIDSYQVYLSYESDSYEEVMTVSGSANQIDLDGLPHGTYYLTIATTDLAGVTGPRSDQISVIIN